MKKIYALIDKIGMDKFAHKYAMQSLSMIATLVSFNIDPSLSPVVHSAIGIAESFATTSILL